MNAAPSAAEAARLGEQHYKKQEWSDAAQSFLDAERAYRAEGDALAAAEMANNRAVALLQDGAAEQALQALNGTAERFLKADDKRRAARAFGNTASAQEALGDFEMAAAAYRRAAALFEEVGDAENRTHTLKALSQLQLRRGQTLEALTSYQQGFPSEGQLPVKQRFLRWLLSLPSRLTGA